MLPPKLLAVFYLIIHYTSSCFRHQKMQLFHVRHRHLLILSAFGGVYLPGLSRIIPWKSVNTFLKAYAVSITTGFLLLATFAMRHAIFEADNLVIQLVSLNNACDDSLAFTRALCFNINRNEAQALYDLWDVYFTSDGHDKIRKKLLEDLKRPNKKYIFGGGLIIHIILVSWATDQFGNENCDFSVDMGFPFNKRNPDFLLSSIFLFVMLNHWAPVLITSDLLIMEPMSWIIAEFMRLRQSLADILDTMEIRQNGYIIRRGNGFQPINNKQELEQVFMQVDEKIKKWIIEHQKLLIFHQKMVAVNHWPLTMQLFFTTMAICLFSYLFALNVFTVFDTFVSIMVYLPNYLIFYLIARYGDLIKEQAHDVFTSAFATNWSIYPKHIQKNLHIIAMRTNYPLTVNMMKHYPLSSKTYFLIVQTAYSVYNFLLFVTIKNEII